MNKLKGKNKLSKEKIKRELYKKEIKAKKMLTKWWLFLPTLHPCEVLPHIPQALLVVC
ncbi:MAG: hypothetical protein JW822_10715 [Spirochaetales bacterium]|nr:hypothetical protein [Spirochaetales bacterium]